MKSTIDMISYFKGVKYSHQAILDSKFINDDEQINRAKIIIKTYDFVIQKLREWDKKGDA